MGRHSAYEDFKEAMFVERCNFRYDYYEDCYDYYLNDDDNEDCYLNDYDNEDFVERGIFRYDYYLNDNNNKESFKIKNSFYWIKLVQRHWKKTFNTNKKYKGMLSIYKL